MININLVPPHLRRKEKKSLFSVSALNLPTQAIDSLVGGVLAMIMVIDALVFFAVIFRWAQHESAKKEWAHILPEKGRIDIVKNDLHGLESKMNSVDKIMKEKRINWSQKLNDISDSLPRGVWLNKLSLDDKVLLMDGSAVSKMKDEMTSVGSFVSNLKNSQSFMNGLNGLELGTIQRRQLKALDLVDFVITVKLP